MLAVSWRIDGFQVVRLMTEWHRYDTYYFLGKVVEPLLSAIFPGGRKSHSRHLSAHIDNRPVHRPKASKRLFTENTIVRVLDLTNGPDLTPSNFWPFGHNKS
jgi:hypothetical protein